VGSFHIVPPGHRGIRVFLGKVSVDEAPEGLALKWPLLETIYDFPLKQIKMDGKAASFSSDLQTIDVSYAVMYRVPESQVVTLFQQYRGDPYQTLIEPRVQEIIKQVTALSRAEDLVKTAIRSRKTF